MQGVIYARLERWEVDQRLLEKRVSQCRNWCRANDVEAIAAFTDTSCSGAHLDRAGFTKLCEFVIKHHCPIVITELEQLTTSVRDAALIADVFEELGIRVYSVKEGLICASQLAALDQALQDEPSNQLHEHRAKGSRKHSRKEEIYRW